MLLKPASNMGCGQCVIAQKLQILRGIEIVPARQHPQLQRALTGALQYLSQHMLAGPINVREETRRGGPGGAWQSYEVVAAIAGRPDDGGCFTQIVESSVQMAFRHGWAVAADHDDPLGAIVERALERIALTFTQVAAALLAHLDVRVLVMEVALRAAAVIPKLDLRALAA